MVSSYTDCSEIREPGCSGIQRLGKLMRASELLFIDPSIDDIGTLLANLRPEVEPHLLDAVRPAARQIAAALEHRRDLDAIHIVAHGAPGHVHFAAGDWSCDSLQRDVNDFGKIGRALNADGELRLWACETGAGARGKWFV